MRCEALTKAGKRCKAASLKGEKTCLFHTRKMLRDINRGKTHTMRTYRGRTVYSRK